MNMSQNSIEQQNDGGAESFAQLFEEYVRSEKREGQIVSGTVTAVERDVAVVDVGLKSEGRIFLNEFTIDGVAQEIRVGDTVDVFIEKLEGKGGRLVLSREKAIRDAAWMNFERTYTQDQNIEGIILGRVKGGFAVNIGGVVAFLPGSQVDIRPVKDLAGLMGVSQTFKILKIDKEHGNVVVSRKAILEELRQESRKQQLATISEGTVLKGVIKNIADYGVFVDLGFMDGLVHITDISWNKISHPSEVLKLQQQVDVVVTKYNLELQRVSLGIKQLLPNPWDGLIVQYPVGKVFKGVVTTVVDYGAFVELKPGIEGLVHHSEMAWQIKNTHPRKLVKQGDEVDVMILEIDVAKHRISLSMKQCKENPWEHFAKHYPVGTKVKGIVKTVVDFGLFVSMQEEGVASTIDILIPAVEISWDKPAEEAVQEYQKGDIVEAVILNIDLERERITAGIKQTVVDSVAQAVANLADVDSVTCNVTGVQKDGIDVELPGGVRAFIKKAELSRHKSEQKPERFAVGDKVDAKVLSFDSGSRNVALSIKALEIAEEKKAMAEFGSTESGASLGDILGAALKKE